MTDSALRLAQRHQAPRLGTLQVRAGLASRFSLAWRAALGEPTGLPPAAPALPRLARQITAYVAALADVHRDLRLHVLHAIARYAWEQTWSTPLSVSLAPTTSEQWEEIDGLIATAHDLDPHGWQALLGDLPTDQRRSAAAWSCVQAAMAHGDATPRSLHLTRKSVRSALRALRGAGMYRELTGVAHAAVADWLRGPGVCATPEPELTGLRRVYVETRPLASSRALRRRAVGMSCPHRASGRTTQRVTVALPNRELRGVGLSLRSCCRDDPGSLATVAFWKALIEETPMRARGLGDASAIYRAAEEIAPIPNAEAWERLAAGSTSLGPMP